MFELLSLGSILFGLLYAYLMAVRPNLVRSVTAIFFLFILN